MALSNELLTQFAKTVNTKEKDEGTTVRGTYKEINGIKYVQLDGSDILTPVTTTVDAETGDKVSVLIKDHNATVMGNISSPAARATVVENLSDTVDAQGNTIQQLDTTVIQQGSSIIQMNTTINQHTTTISQHDTTIRQQGDQITSIGNTVNQQGNTITSLNNTVNQQGDQITSIGNTVTAQGNTITQHDNRITQNENNITQQGNTISQYGDQITSIGNTVTAQGNTITSLNNTVVSQGNTISQQGDSITSLNNTVTAQGNTITAHGTAITAADAQITILNSGFNIVDGVLTGLSAIVVNDLKTNTLNTQYAKIDFANIGISAIQKLFTDSGIINNLVVQDQHITGELAGVTINGDSINAGTLKADRLVVKGSNGMYYKLNIDGMDHISVSEAGKFVVTTSQPSNWSDNYKDYYIISNGEYIHVTGAQAPTWAANTYYKLKSTYESGLDGTTIVAHTITADKVSVNDLVAFGATIGGFNITAHSLYSGIKSGINNTSPGIYLGDDGQIYIGDSNNRLRYYKDQNNQWKFEIIAEKLYFGSQHKDIEQALEEVEGTKTFVNEIPSNYKTGDLWIIPLNCYTNTYQIQWGTEYDYEEGTIDVIDEETKSIIYKIEITEVNPNTDIPSEYNVNIPSTSDHDISGTYIRNIDIYTVLSSQPSDWSTNWEDYYILDNQKYVHVTGQTAPTWAANTYYSKQTDILYNLVITSTTNTTIPSGAIGGETYTAIHDRASYNSSDWVKVTNSLSYDEYSIFSDMFDNVSNNVSTNNDDIIKLNDDTSNLDSKIDDTSAEIYDSIDDRVKDVTDYIDDQAETLQGNINGVDKDLKDYKDDMVDILQGINDDISDLKKDISSVQVFYAGILDEAKKNLLKNSVGFRKSIDNGANSRYLNWTYESTTVKQNFEILSNDNKDIVLAFKYKTNNPTTNLDIKIQNGTGTPQTICTLTGLHSSWTTYTKDLKNDISTLNPALCFSSLFTTYSNDDVQQNSLSGNIMSFCNDKIQITDLIIKYKEKDEKYNWSCHPSETYGKNMVFDAWGLDMRDEATQKLVHLDHDSLNFFDEQGNQKSIFSEEMSKTNKMITDRIEIGNLKIIALDPNNILEY